MVGVKKKGKLRTHELSKSLAELFESRLRSFPSFCYTWKTPIQERAL